MNLENRSPVCVEETLSRLPITGWIPVGLAGTLYRNGPNPFDPNPQLHWFVGNGMVHAFRIGGDGISYRNRWVHTRHWASAAGQPDESLPDGVANTNVVANAGKLLALEELHMPVVLDKADLTTLGATDFAGALPTGPFTAHPKTCPVTGNLVFFGYAADGYFSNTIRLGEVTQEGRLARLDKISAPYGGAMIHDFAVTRRFIAIPLFPLVLDAEQGFFVWKPALGAHLGVIDRRLGPDSLRWLPLEEGFAFHVANAWDDGDTLTIDLMRSDAPPFFPQPQDRPAASTDSFLTRWRIDLGRSAAGIEQQRLSPVDGEFPRIDERWTGRRNRHTYWSAGGALLAFDAETGKESRYFVNDGDGISEPIFVQRGEAEGDGWITAVVYRGATKTSDLVILDASAIADGPIAQAHLPVRVPDGFHGTWLGDAS